jgi:hypothetical protein
MLRWKRFASNDPSSDSYWTIKISDFGLAALLDPHVPIRDMCGTPGFIAPEVINPRLTGMRRWISKLACNIYIYIYICVYTYVYTHVNVYVKVCIKFVLDVYGMSDFVTLKVIEHTLKGDYIYAVAHTHAHTHTRTHKYIRQFHMHMHAPNLFPSQHLPNHQFKLVNKNFAHMYLEQLCTVCVYCTLLLGPVAIQYLCHLLDLGEILHVSELFSPYLQEIFS